MTARIVPALLLLALPALAQSAPKADARAQLPRVWVGVGLEVLSPELRKQFRVPADINYGLLVTRVVEKSPAERAGLRAGDVMLSLQGKKITNPQMVRDLLLKRAPGDKIAYMLRRGHGSIAGTIVLGDRSKVTSETPVRVVKPKRVAPAPPAPGDVDKRLDRVQRDLEALQKRIEAARKRKSGKSKEDGVRRRAQPRKGPLQGRIAREERALMMARKKGDRAAMDRHETRLELLRELNATMPGRATTDARRSQRRAKNLRDPANTTQARLDRIEKKLDALLAALTK